MVVEAFRVTSDWIRRGLGRAGTIQTRGGAEEAGPRGRKRPTAAPMDAPTTPTPPPRLAWAANWAAKDAADDDSELGGGRFYLARLTKKMRERTGFRLAIHKLVNSGQNLKNRIELPQ